MTGPAWRRAVLLLALAAAGCASSQTAAQSEPGSVTVHMGGSFTSFGGAVSSSR